MIPERLKLLITLPMLAFLFQIFPASGQARQYRSYYHVDEVVGSSLSVGYDIHTSLGYDNHDSYNMSKGFSLGFESAPFGDSGLQQIINGFANLGVMSRMNAPYGVVNSNNTFFNGEAGLRLGYIITTSLPYLAFRPHFDFSVNYRAINSGIDNLATKAAIKVDVLWSNPYSNSFLQGVKEMIEIGPYMDTRLNDNAGWGGMIGRRIDVSFKLACNLDPQ